MYDNINTTRSRDQRLWLYLHFYKTGNIQMSQQKRPASADLTLQVMMTLLQPSWVISVFAFIPTSISSITTKLGRMTDLLNLPCRRWRVHHKKVTRLTFIPTSLNPITTKTDRMVDQHALMLPCRYDNVTTTNSHDKS